MKFKFTTVFFTVLATLVTVVAGARLPELLQTNAARFANGLPPLPPRSMGRRDGTPVQGM